MFCASALIDFRRLMNGVDYDEYENRFTRKVCLMKKWNLFLVIMVLFSVLFACNAMAYDHWHHGRPHWRGPYWGGPRIVIDPWFPLYYPPPPVVVQPAPVYQPPEVYIQQPPPAPPEQGYWYYCEGAKAYYPYVKECPGGWMKVLPQPTPNR